MGRSRSPPTNGPEAFAALSVATRRRLSDRSAEDERDVARRILLRLVAGGDSEALTRRRVTRAELDADDDERVARVLAALVERRLLVADDGTVELVHEALLERWPRLAGWLAEDAQGRVLHRRLAQAALGVGRRRARRKRALPGRTPRRRRSSGRTRHAPELNRLESEFLDESRTALRTRDCPTTTSEPAATALASPSSPLLALSIAAAVVALQQGAGAETGTRRRRAAPRSAGALRPKPRPLAPARSARALASTTRLRRAATCSPRSCAAPRRSASRTKAATACSTKRSAPTAASSPSAATTATSSSSTRDTCAESGGRLRQRRRSASFGAVPDRSRALAFSRDGRNARRGRPRLGQRDHRARRQPHTRASWTLCRVDPSASLIADVAFAPDGRTFATGEPVNGTPPPAARG